MSSNHSFSATVAGLVTLVLIVVGQFFKEHLAASRPGTLAAGGLGSLVFVFALTAISNLKMASASSASAIAATRSGLGDAGIALALAVCASASIHRVAITICILFSAAFLFLLIGVSKARYQQPIEPAAHGANDLKKRK